MSINLNEAWEQIQADEILNEKKKHGAKKVFEPKNTKGVKADLKKEIKKEKLDEDGVSGANGAGVGGNPAPTAGGSMTTTDNIAKFADKLKGMKERDEKKKKMAEMAKMTTAGNPKNPNHLGSSVDSQTVKEGMGAVNLDKAKDKLAQAVNKQAQFTNQGGDGVQLEDELPPGADEIANDLDMDPHAEGPEAAADAELANPEAEEENEDVAMDAETAEQVVDGIMKKYPGAVITISVSMPDGTPFDTDLVAAAQEVVGGGDVDMGSDMDGEEGGDMSEPVSDDADVDNLMEARKVAIVKTRKQIKEMFARMQSEEGMPGDETVDAPTDDAAVDMDAQSDVPVDMPTDVPAEMPSDSKVTDNKIALTPEQWGQVLATTDLLNVGGEDMGDVSSGDMDSASDMPSEEPIKPGNKLAELKKVHDLDKNKTSLKVEPKDFSKDVKQDVSIKQKPPVINEEWNRELDGYANALKQLLP